MTLCEIPPTWTLPPIKGLPSLGRRTSLITFPVFVLSAFQKYHLSFAQTCDGDPASVDGFLLLPPVGPPPAPLVKCHAAFDWVD